MNKQIEITDSEKKLIIKYFDSNKLTIYRVLYLLLLVLPFIICYVMTFDFYYLIGFLIFLILFLIYYFFKSCCIKKYLLANKVYKYESKVLSCKRDIWYFNLVEINNIDGEFIDYKFPVKKSTSKDEAVTVIMLKGNKKYRDYLLMQDGKIITNKNSRFDYIRN